MKLTVSNIRAEFPKIKHLLSQEYIELYEGLTDDMLEFYNEDDDIRESVDEVLLILNEGLEKAQRESAPNDEPEPKPEPKPRKPHEKKPKEPKPKKEPKVDSRIEVEDKTLAVKIISRFVKLHGKTVCVTTKDEARKVLAALQKAVISKQIRKTDEYAKEIMDIQDSLIKITKLTSGDIVIKGIEHYKEIANGYKIMKPAALIRSFIAIQGKTDVKNKAKNLFEKIAKYRDANPGGKYLKELEQIAVSLQDYTGGRTDTPEMSEMQLNGLYGLAGIECKTKSGSAVNSREFLGAVFDIMPFTSKWKQIIGMPEDHFRIMFYGKAGSGKSTLALQFAKYLATLGKKVLYVADEERFGYTLQEKIKRLNVAHQNLSIIDKIPSNVSTYDIIFLDSVNSMGLDAEALRKLSPSKSFVYVFQSTKDGQFRGENAFSHDVDVVIRVEDMKATTEKSRFGGSGTVRVL